MKNAFKVFMGALAAVLLIGCGCDLTGLFSRATAIPTAPPSTEVRPPTEAPPTGVPTEDPADVEEIILQRATSGVTALKNADMVSLAQLVHPGKGVRFSPNGFVQNSDLVFLPGEVSGLMNDTTVRNWGLREGSGLPIEATFAEYYGQFVYDQDFLHAEEWVFDTSAQTAFMNNIHEFYPGSHYIEFYFPGFDPAYSGLDWEALKLVFLPDEDGWYLVGVVHSAWSP